jgi:hypothetical protein
VDHFPLLLCDLFFMCLRRTLRIFRIAVYFYIVLYKGLYGWERGVESPPLGRREFTLSRWGREGEGHWVGPENHIKLTTCSKEYRKKQNTITEYSFNKTHVHKTTDVPVYQYIYPFFIWRLDLLIFLGAIHSLVAISGPKESLDFQGPPLPMAIEMDLPPSKSFRPAPYKQQIHFQLL